MYHRASSSDITIHSKQDQIKTAKLDIILDYNKHETGAERSDQMTAYHVT